MSIRVAINGFGRIGRQIARLILTNSTSQIKLVAVNSVEEINSCAFLLKHDSTHGLFLPEINIIDAKLQVGNHQPIPFFNHVDPQNTPWTKFDVDIVIESTGQFTHNHAAEKHLAAGTKKVIITAATDFPDVTICSGVNNQDYQKEDHNVISASSCTTNCIAPIVKTIIDNFGFVSGMATFLHSYTGSQPLLDSFQKDLRRSRSAALSIIPTTTSAEHQLPLILPETAGRFNAIAIRVPTPLTHLADFTVKIGRPVTRDEFFKVFQDAASQSMKDIISLNNQQLVSVDYKKSHYSSVIDINSTKIYNNLVKMILWHNNEYSYSCRVIDLVNFVGKSLR
jgi:glyceraldehyde 3-phosphate dehydrogenase